MCVSVFSEVISIYVLHVRVGTALNHHLFTVYAQIPAMATDNLLSSKRLKCVGILCAEERPFLGGGGQGLYQKFRERRHLPR